MKIGVISLVLLIVLTGCGDSSEIERGMTLRSVLLKSPQASFDADVIADYGNYVTQFTLNCTFDSQGNMRFTVRKPETIAGIIGCINGQKGALTFDDTVLYFDLMTDEQISPVAAPWILMKTLRSGYLTSACQDGELLLLTVDDRYEDDALTLDIWLDQNNHPLRSEILFGGKRILSVSVSNFVIL